MVDTFVWEMHKVRKGLWALFLDCDFRVLIGWAGKLRSRDHAGCSRFIYRRSLQKYLKITHLPFCLMPNMLSIIPQLVFEGEVGDSPRSDIAIDDFSMSQSYVIDDVICPLRPACARPPVTPPTPSPPTGEYNGKWRQSICNNDVWVLHQVLLQKKKQC